MLRKTVKILLPVLLTAVFFSSMFTLKAGAESRDDGGSFIREFISELFDYGEGESETPETEPGFTEPEPPTEYTVPETEPEPTRPVETVPPQTEAPATEEPEQTYRPEYEETESPRDEYAQLLEEAEEPTGMNSVKMDKSVSNKAYTTDNTAGIVSWICVGVGLVVVAVMLITTKITGRRASQREV